MSVYVGVGRSFVSECICEAPILPRWVRRVALVLLLRANGLRRRKRKEEGRLVRRKERAKDLFDVFGQAVW